MPTTLLLQLAGPMQSWGFRSRFDNRDTGLEPTRSGVVGLLCAALGWGRDTDLRFFDPLVMGVRVEKAGAVALDYHTATPVWRDKEAATTQSNRYYLSDARFLVALQSEDDGVLEKLENALKNPVWPLFLGRKSFAPGIPIHFADSGLRDGDCESVLRTQPWQFFSQKEEWSAQKSLPALRLILETLTPTQGVAAPDVPRDFERRRYSVRYLRNDSCVAPSVERHPLFHFERAQR